MVQNPHKWFQSAFINAIINLPQQKHADSLSSLLHRLTRIFWPMPKNGDFSISWHFSLKGFFSWLLFCGIFLFSGVETFSDFGEQILNGVKSVGQSTSSLRITLSIWSSGSQRSDTAARNFIAPQSFSGGGLVFKCKLVTMERVWWVTMIVHEGLLWISNDWLLWYMGHTSMCRFREGIVTFFGGGWFL